MKKHCLGMIACAIVLAVFMLATAALAADAPAKGPGAPNAEKLGWRLAIQAWSFKEFTLFEAIDKTASLGLKYIEAFPGQALSPEKDDVKFDQNISPEIMQEVKAKLTATGVKMVNFGVTQIPEDEKEARKLFEFAKAMGLETICAEPPAEQMPTVDRLAQEYGINIAIHNHPKPSRYWSPDAFLKAVDGRSKRIGACADTGHWPRSGLNSLDCLKKIDGRIISLHFKDLNEEGPKAHDVPWGTGVCNVKSLLAELKRQGFKGVFSIEYEYNWDNSVPDIAKSVEFFDKTAAELAK